MPSKTCAISVLTPPIWHRLRHRVARRAKTPVMVRTEAGACDKSNVTNKCVGLPIGRVRESLQSTLLAFAQ